MSFFQCGETFKVMTTGYESVENMLEFSKKQWRNQINEKNLYLEWVCKKQPLMFNLHFGREYIYIKKNYYSDTLLEQVFVR